MQDEPYEFRVASADSGTEKEIVNVIEARTAGEGMKKTDKIDGEKELKTWLQNSCSGSALHLKTHGELTATTFASLPEHIESLRLEDCEVTDDAMAAIANLPHLREIILTEVGGFSGAALPAMAGKLPLLSTLILDHSEPTNEGLRHLDSLKRLASLTVTKTSRIRDLEGLADLKNISRLDLTLCVSLSSAFLRDLKGKPIAGLNLNGIQFDIEDLASALPLPGLEVLHLEGCLLKSADLETLSKITGLRTLYLARNPEVGDAGLPCLARLKKLEFLSLARQGGHSRRSEDPGKASGSCDQCERLSGFR